MNKAQKDYIESWFEGIESHNIEMSRYDLAGFGKEYGAINPEPDKLLYVMMYKGITGKWGVNHPETFTKEEADEKLHNIMKDSSVYVREYRAGEYLKLLFPKEDNYSEEWTQEFRIDQA